VCCSSTSLAQYSSSASAPSHGALLRQQHALHIRVLDDRHLRAGRVLSGRAHRAPLRTLLGIGQRGLVARHAQHRRGQADRDARLVHHVEHAGQALARRADAVADRPRTTTGREPALAEVQQRVGRAAPAALVVQAGQRDVVALAGEAALGVHQPLGHDEERDAARAWHQLAVRTGDLGQHQVDDVAGEFVLAGGDPHLVAAQAVTRAQRVALEVLAVRHRPGQDVRQAGARLRLGQAHRAGPLAAELPGGEDALLRLAAVRHQQVGVAAGEHAGDDAHRGLAQEGVRRRLHGVGQLHAAQLVVLRGGQQAGVGQRLPGLVGGLRQDHLLAVKARLVGVHQPVEGRVLLAGDALAGVEHLAPGLAAVVRKPGPRGERLGVQPVVQQELEGGAHGERGWGDGWIPAFAGMTEGSRGGFPPSRE
jgi:hypothetical protein